MSVRKKPTPGNGVPAESSSGRNVLHEGVTVRSSLQDARRNDPDNQLQIFEQAVKELQARRFREARALFEKAVDGPQKEISHNARLHIIMCDRRIEAPALELKGLDDHYNYAIERINARDLECARKHLDTALDLSEDHTADHLFYALAVCASLAGDPRGAYENLKRAIEIDPRNRLAARNDSDFSTVAQQPLLQQLLYPEKHAG